MTSTVDSLFKPIHELNEEDLPRQWRFGNWKERRWSMNMDDQQGETLQHKLTANNNRRSHHVFEISGYTTIMSGGLLAKLPTQSPHTITAVAVDLVGLFQQQHQQTTQPTQDSVVPQRTSF